MTGPGLISKAMERNQRVTVPLGSGAGNDPGAGCGWPDCAACAGVDWSGGGAVVRLRTIFFGFGAGGAAVVEPSSSAAGSAAGSVAGSVAAVAGCLPLA